MVEITLLLRPIENWYSRQESHLQHSPSEGDALSVELREREGVTGS